MRADFMRAPLGMWLALAAAGCSSIVSPSSPDKNWNVSTSGHFTYYVRPGSFAESSLGALTPVLEDQFASSVAALQLRYNGHLTLYLYNSGADAGFDDDAGGGDHSGVAYPDTETVKVAVVPPFNGNLMALVSHEINHVIVRGGLGRAGTSFMNEGLASALVSERFHALGRTFHHHWIATHPGQFPRISALVDDDGWRDVNQFVAYTTAASFLAYLIETHGPDRLKAVYASRSSEFAGRFQATYGLTLDQAQDAWTAFVAGR